MGAIDEKMLKFFKEDRELKCINLRFPRNEYGILDCRFWIVD